jgi:hypothetical protein
MLATRPRPTPPAETETVFLWGRFLAAAAAGALLVAGFVFGCHPSPAPLQTVLFTGLVAWGLWETVRGGLYQGRAAEEEAEGPSGWPAAVQALGSAVAAVGLVVVIAAIVMYDEVTMARLQLAVPATAARSLLIGGVGALALGTGAWAAAVLTRPQRGERP